MRLLDSAALLFLLTLEVCILQEPQNKEAFTEKGHFSGGDSAMPAYARVQAVYQIKQFNKSPRLWGS
jgi:hypothetical protein